MVINDSPNVSIKQIYLIKFVCYNPTHVHIQHCEPH